MSILDIFTHTPLWVWALFAFLLMRGIIALRTRTTRPGLMLILPVVFFVWALIAILFELPVWHLPLAAFVVTLAIGYPVGRAIAVRMPAARFDPATGRILRPGSSMPLILILVGFISKYIMAVLMATAPEISASSRFLVTYGAISGLVDGIFWGAVILQLRRALKDRALKAGLSA